MGIETEWVYPLTDITQDKSVRRVGIYDRSRSPDLVGFDGSVEGSLRPHRGFNELLDLSSGVGLSLPSGESLTIKPGDLRPFSVRADASRNVIGYVFRHTVTAGSDWTFYISYYFNGTWTTEALVSGDTTIDYSGSEAGGKWTIFSQKTGLYVYLNGFTPLRVIFPVDDNSTSGDLSDDSVTATILSQDLDRRVKLYAFDEYDDVATLEKVPFIPDTAGSPTSYIADEDDNEIPGAFVFGCVNVESLHQEGSTSSTARYSQTFGTRFADAGPESPNIDPTTQGIVTGVNTALLESGDTEEYPLSSPQVQRLHINYDTNQGSTGIAFATKLSVPKFPGNKFLGVMIELFNTVTGVRSLPSEVSELNVRYQNSQVAFEGVVDSATYDTVRIYRTVAGDTVGAGQATLYLIAEHTITDITSPFQFDATYLAPDGGTTSSKYTRVSGVFTLSDVAVMYQPPLLDRIQYAEEAPKGGVAALYNGVAFLTDIKGTSGLDSSVGEVLYSTLSETRPEAFPPVNRFLPEQATDTIKAWAVAGGNLLGFSSTQQYFARIEGQFVKFLGIHDGFGLAGEHAHETISDQIYLMTTKGLMMVNGRGALEGIDVFNDLVINDWLTDLGTVTMAFDPDVAALFIMNEAKDQASVIWLTTSKTTQMHDLPFSGVVRGITFEDEIRAQFYREDGRVYTYNYGGTVSTLFDLNGGTANLKVSVDNGSGNFTVTTVSGGSPTLTSEMVGETVYFTTGDLKMQKFTVSAINNTTKQITLSGYTSGAAVGDRMAVSPIFCRAMGAAVVPQVQGQQFASYIHPSTRKVQSIFCHFEDTSGTDVSECGIYTASVWKGNATSPERRDQAVEHDGTTIPRTIDDGTTLWYTGIDAERGVEGRLIFPAVETAVANFDFNLVAMLVKGRIERTETERSRI
jgi:hypothetical protein